MKGSIEIIKLYSKDITRELTIRQISKLIKKSYAYTNKEVWLLIKQDVLNKKIIGKSVVCSINIKNNSAKALLVFNSILEGNEKKKNDILIKELKEKDALTVFLSKNKLFVVCADKSNFKNIKANLLAKHEFISSIKNIGFDNSVIYGHEKYWELIGDAVE